MFKDTKERISNRINIRGKAFEKIKPAVLSRPYNQYPPRYLADSKSCFFFPLLSSNICSLLRDVN